MSDGATVAYRLRPNKAVDRELFISFLLRLSATLRIERYQYVGLGGAFLEEFRLLHARTGISDMACIEREEAVHKRQEFNKPIATVECFHKSLEDYLGETEFAKPIVLWLDYTTPDEMQSQIDCFCDQVATLPLFSIVRLTLNASPSSLGTPRPDEIAVDLFEGKSEGKPTLHQWRLDRLKKRLSYVPNSITSDQLKTKQFGPALIQTLRMSLEKHLEGYFDRKIVWGFSTHYSDGQPMVTSTVVVVPPEDQEVERVVSEWDFHSGEESLLVIDMPALSTRERLTLEASKDPRKCLEYKLPKSALRADPYDGFTLLYRVFPHFATVDL